MKKALVNKNETLDNGWRLCQIADETFDVHPDLYWVDVPDNTDESKHYWTGDAIAVRSDFVDIEIPVTQA